MTIRALTIAASDPSGGAGIEADVKTLSAHRVFALTALTAITVQDSRKIRQVTPTDPRLFTKTLELLKNDRPINAVKTGALATAAHLEAVSAFLKDIDQKIPVVIDPVMRATSGADLAGEDAPAMIAKLLLPRATLITPNLYEASLLAGMPVEDVDAMKEAAKKLCRMGARAVLVKGGHLDSDPLDVLCIGDKIIEWNGRRLPHEYHGTGCVLASAIAANLARGAAIEQAVTAGRGYLASCMKAARPGSGKAYLLDFPPASIRE